VGHPVLFIVSVILKRCIAQRVYTVYTRINYIIIPVTNLNKLVQAELNMYINVGANNGSEKITKKRTLRLPVS
jgi:hypothetical protein